MSFSKRKIALLLRGASTCGFLLFFGGSFSFLRVDSKSEVNDDCDDCEALQAVFDIFLLYMTGR